MSVGTFYQLIQLITIKHLTFYRKTVHIIILIVIVMISGQNRSFQNTWSGRRVQSRYCPGQNGTNGNSNLRTLITATSPQRIA